MLITVGGYFDLPYHAIVTLQAKSRGQVSWTHISGLLRPTIISKGSLESRKSRDFHGVTQPRSLTLPRTLVMVSSVGTSQEQRVCNHG